MTRNIVSIDVSKFSETPGGRYERYGKFSGERFRREMLAPALRKARESGDLVQVRIDTVRRSYQSSFLEEAFGGLIRSEGFDRGFLDRHLEILCDIPRFRHYRQVALDAIDEARKPELERAG